LPVEGLLLLVILRAAPCAAQQTPARATGTITGHVVDSLATPIAGAIVTLDTLGLGTTTDSAGAFRFAGVPAGRRTLTVHVLQSAAATAVVAVAAGGTADETIRAKRVVATLPAVRSQAVGQFGKPARLAYTTKYDEFYRRRAMSSTSGMFFTHEDLAKMDAPDLPDMFRHVPYLRFQPDIDRNELTFPGCGTNHILIKLDGQRVWPPDSLLRGFSGTVPAPPRYWSTPTGGGGSADPLEVIGTLHLQNVEAMEVYKDMSSLPYDAAGEVCGAIYIWTR
jgi:hypothetical protein